VVVDGQHALNSIGSGRIFWGPGMYFNQQKNKQKNKQKTTTNNDNENNKKSTIYRKQT